MGGQYPRVAFGGAAGGAEIRRGLRSLLCAAISEGERGYFVAVPIRSQRSSGRRRKRAVVVAVEPEPSRLALSVPQVAWLLGTSPNFVWGLLAKGQIASFHLGRRRMIARSEVERFIAHGGTKAS